LSLFTFSIMRLFIVILVSFFCVSALFSAVEFVGMNAEIVDHNVMLSWSTATETENAGFILERKLDSLANWGPLASYLNSDALLGQGTTSSPSNYSFTDSSVILNETYYYRISGVDAANNIGVLDSLFITVAETGIKEIIPDGFNLRLYPNPFNPIIVISYSISTKTSMDRQQLGSSRIKATIYNSNGRIVKKLLASEMSIGTHDIIWDASNMPSGVYIIKMQVGEIMHSQKAVLMK
jgi:Secretion system C-terminal sorting domain